ncbi:nucleolar protein 58 isoform X1 [Phymastichus coffea]|uniref:nucleolar protein 58 isoform X1 n=1 Tax=Phymastichus coffea TaxID=108790 RepID=UPI00273B7CC5|nr:nucleolar protein 58 isoform X1 [Phymastichus coffea]
MLVLFETPAGYAIFKLLDENKLSKSDNLYLDFETPERAGKVLKLKHFEKFADTTEALAATTAAVEGKLCKSLKKLLKRQCSEVQEQLAVADAKLGNAIKAKLNLACLSNSSVQELMRCIRTQLDSLLVGLPKKEMAAMALGLAHSLSRYKLKFSPDKIDTMIVQAVSLLDDLDKELNNYVMRCREWYGWHFPELGKIIADNTAFVKAVKLIGTRENAVTSDFSDILSEEVEEKVKCAAETSMGTEISHDDIINIQQLCDQVIEISTYRAQLYDYLKTRMMAMAPNLTVLVGDLVGARLISHAGSLINLAKHPASTLQILGAEKALFRALKTKKDTPKYGLIYHSQIVGQATTRNKGKISRMLAAKAALCTRVDALGEDADFELGAEHRVKLENRLRLLEEGNLRKLSGTAKAKAKFEKFHCKSEILEYPASADTTLPAGKRKYSQIQEKPLIEEVGDIETFEAPKKKKKKNETEMEVEVEVKVEEAEENIPQKKKKKKAKQETAEEEAQELEETESIPEGKKKKKKKKKNRLEEAETSQLEVEEQDPTVIEETVPGEKKKKKKNKSLSTVD